MLKIAPSLPHRTFLVPGLLIAVVLFHLYGFFHHDRSSWGTGLGFGMFATAESHGSRWLVVSDLEGERHVIDWGNSSDIPLVAKTLASPTAARLEACANRYGCPVELYGTRFDPQSWQLRSVVIGQGRPTEESQ